MVGMSVGHSRSVSVGNSGSVGIGHSGSNGSGSGVDNGSDLTDGVNKTVLVVVFGESLRAIFLNPLLVATICPLAGCTGPAAAPEVKKAFKGPQCAMAKTAERQIRTFMMMFLNVNDPH